MSEETAIVWCSEHEDVQDDGFPHCRSRLRDEAYGWEPITDCAITHRVDLVPLSGADNGRNGHE